MPFVEILKIHCWLVESQRNAASGVVLTTASSTVCTTVPAMIFTRLKESPLLPNRWRRPRASHTSGETGNATELVANTKRAALAMFPDKEFAYDIIYKPRLQRLMRERFRTQ